MKEIFELPFELILNYFEKKTNVRTKPIIINLKISLKVTEPNEYRKKKVKHILIA